MVVGRDSLFSYTIFLYIRNRAGEGRSQVNWFNVILCSVLDEAKQRTPAAGVMRFAYKCPAAKSSSSKIKPRERLNYTAFSATTR